MMEMFEALLDPDHVHHHNPPPPHDPHQKQDVKLFLAHKERSPAQLFQLLTERCEELGVKKSDVYGDFNDSEESSALRRFEAEVAEHLGKEDALFLPSGVMAAGIVLATAKEATSSSKFVCHYSSHLLLHENEAYAHLLGMEALVAQGNANAAVQKPMSSEQVATLLGSADNKAAAVVLEVPHRELGGKCTSMEEMARMSQLCRSHGVHFHMDGARLWEASSAFEAPLAEIAALFDTVYVSFYKGLGSIAGAMLLGDRVFIDKARMWLRRFGGNLYSQLPYFVSSWAGFRDHKNSFQKRKMRLREVMHHLNQHLLSKASYNSVVDEMVMGEDETFFTDHASFHHVIRFDPPVPEVPMVHVVIDADLDTAKIANELAAKHTGITCFKRFTAGVFGNAGKAVAELNMGPENMTIRNEVWVQGWSTYLAELKALKTAHY